MIRRNGVTWLVEYDAKRRALYHFFGQRTRGGEREWLATFFDFNAGFLWARQL